MNNVRVLLKFFFSSAIGLVVDLASFGMLASVNIPAGVANLISSTLAISVVYFTAVRIAFRQDAQIITYFLFFSWYSLSTLMFSALIQIFTDRLGEPSFAIKLYTVPISFGLNYFFSRYVLWNPRRTKRDL